MIMLYRNLEILLSRSNGQPDGGADMKGYVGRITPSQRLPSHSPCDMPYHPYHIGKKRDNGKRKVYVVLF